MGCFHRVLYKCHDLLCRYIVLIQHDSQSRNDRIHRIRSPEQETAFGNDRRL